MKRGATGLRGNRRTVIDGLALAALVAALFCAEAFDEARDTLASLYDRTGATEAYRPAGLVPAWIAVAVIGGGAGLYVASRFITIANELDRSRSGGAGRGVTARLRAGLPWFAYSAVLVWLAWQGLAIAEVANPGAELPITPWIRWIAFFLAVMAVGVGGAVPGDATWAIERAPVVRVQLLFLAGLFAVVFAVPITSAQIVDVLRAWGDESSSRPAAGVAAALLLGADCRASAARLLVPNTGPARGPTAEVVRKVGVEPLARRATRPDHLVVGVCLAVGLVLILIPAFEAAAILALGIAALVSITRPVDRSRLARGPATVAATDDDRVSLRRLAGTLGVVPLGVLLAGLVEASVGSLLLPSGPSLSDKTLLGWTLAVIVLFGLLAARAHAAAGTPATDLDDRTPAELVGVVGFGVGVGVLIAPTVAAWLLLAFALLLAFKAFGERGARELWGAWGVALGVGFAVYLEPIPVSRRFGTFGLALVGATAVLALLHVAGSIGIRRELRWKLCGRRLAAPVVLLIVAWWVGAALTAPERAHQARTVPASGEQPATLDAAVSAWLDRQPAPDEGGYVPMLLVGASGGGSKAAYWTDLVLDCILGEGAPVEGEDECGGSGRAGDARYRRLFLTSSVSGGSVGIHHLLNHENKAGGDTPWIKNTAGREVLSPVVAWGMFHDLPAFLLGLPTDPSKCTTRLGCPLNADRALVQEAAIAVFGDGTEADADAGLLPRSGPLTVFNAAVTKRAWLPTGRRVLVSRAALAPSGGCPPTEVEPAVQAIDGHDLLDTRDIPLVTAAMLSARFPVVEPSARVGMSPDVSDGGGCEAREIEPAVRRLSDGGLYENTGLLTITQLLRSIRRSIEAWTAEDAAARAAIDVRPIVLSIDDDVQQLAGDEQYKTGLFGTSLFGDSAADGRSSRARKQLRSCTAFPGVTFRRISPSPHVGAQAATGWEISETSRREDLGETLRSRANTRNDGIQEIREMLDGTRMPVCTRPQPPR